MFVYCDKMGVVESCCLFVIMGVWVELVQVSDVYNLLRGEWKIEVYLEFEMEVIWLRDVKCEGWQNFEFDNLFFLMVRDCVVRFFYLGVFVSCSR